MVNTSVLIVGAGAIGGVTAAKMQGKVRRVAVLDADREHVRRMRDAGLLLDDLGERRTVRLAAHADPRDPDGPFEFALVTVKAGHLEAALRPLTERGLAKTFVSLGNGLVQDRVASIVGGENLIVGTVEWGATNMGPGHLKRTTRAPFVVGEQDGRTRERTRLLAEALGTVSEVRVTSNIRGQVWSKLLVNSTFSGLGTVTGLLYREAVEGRGGKEVALALWREGYDVGAAQGLKMEEFVGVGPETLVVRGPDDLGRAEEALARIMSQVGPTKASMLQDLQRGARTEVDVINGGVVRKGKERGVNTPLNARIVELVHKMERGETEPAPERLEEFHSLVG
jgi:2-dehydropantoate 2-reductase